MIHLWPLPSTTTTRAQVMVVVLRLGAILVPTTIATMARDTMATEETMAKVMVVTATTMAARTRARVRSRTKAKEEAAKTILGRRQHTTPRLVPSNSSPRPGTLSSVYWELGRLRHAMARHTAATMHHKASWSPRPRRNSSTSRPRSSTQRLQHHSSTRPRCCTCRIRLPRRLVQQPRLLGIQQPLSTSSKPCHCSNWVVIGSWTQVPRHT